MSGGKRLRQAGRKLANRIRDLLRPWLGFALPTPNVPGAWSLRRLLRAFAAPGHDAMPRHAAWRHGRRSVDRAGLRLALDPMEARLLLSAVLQTDRLDYPPGSTALFTATTDGGATGNYLPGETLRFEVLRVDGSPIVAPAVETFCVTDGFRGFPPRQDEAGMWCFPDLDGVADGKVETNWYVDWQFANTALTVTATGLTSAAWATAAFTDSVTVNSPEVSISADKAADAPGGGAFTPIGNIVLPESLTADFSAGTNVTLILGAPSGWQFNAGVGSISYTTGRNITSASLVVTASTIAVTYSTNGINYLDSMTISGVEVQPLNGLGVGTTAAIRRTGGTGTIQGVSNGNQIFAELTKIAGIAKKLGFSQQPAGGIAGQAIAPSVKVQLQDQFGNLVSTNGVSVSLAFVDNASGAILNGGVASTSAGVATFSALSIDKSGIGYSLVATASGLDATTSNPFAIATAAPVISSPTTPVTSNSGTFTIAGTASAGSLVQVWSDATRTTLAGSQQLEPGASIFAIAASLAPNSVNNLLVTATDSGGVESSAAAVQTITHDNIAPAMTNLTSTAANGSHGNGVTIPITVRFDQAVWVTGSPQLLLNSGGTATYASGSGTINLVFNYIVQPSHVTADLDALNASSLVLNGGTIRDAAGNDAALAVPTGDATGALAKNKDLAIATSGAPVALGSVTQNSSGSTSLVLSNITAPQGDRVFVTLATQLATGVITMTDSAGNSYALVSDATNVADITNSGAMRTLLFSARISNALASGSITATFPTGGARKVLSAFRVSGLGEADAVITGESDSGSPSLTTAATTRPDALILGIIGINGAPSAPSVGSGYTQITTGTVGSSTSASAMTTEYKTVSTIGPQTITATTGYDWSAIGAAFAYAVPTVGSIELGPVTVDSVSWRVNFNLPIKGLDAADFVLVKPEGSTAAITGISGGGSEWMVTASRGSVDGGLALSLADNDSIVNSQGIKLGGTGVDNGSLAGPAHTLDATAPQVISIARHEPAGAAFNGDAVTWLVSFSAAVSGVTATHFGLNGVGGTGSIQTSASDDGGITWRVQVSGLGNTEGDVWLSLDSSAGIVDTAGNALSTATFAGDAYLLDHVAPTVATSFSGTPGSAGWYTQAGQLSLDVTDAGSGMASVVYRINGGEWASYSAPVAVGAGVHAIEVLATDAAGNERPASFSLYVDTEAPATVAVVSGTRNNGIYVSPVRVTLSSGDLLSGVSATHYRLDGGVLVAYGEPILIADDGSHTLEYFSTDAAGNQEAAVTLQFQVDQTAPVLTLNAPASPSSQSMPTFTGSAGMAAGDGAVISLHVFAGSEATGTPVRIVQTAALGGTYAATVEESLLPGTYTVIARQADDAGNVGFSAAHTFVVTTVATAFVELQASTDAIAYGAGSVGLSGRLTGAPVGSEVTVTIGGITRHVMIDAAGSFGLEFDTRGLHVAGEAYPIVLAYAGNASTDAATDNSLTLMVHKRTLTVSGIMALDKTYDGTAAAALNCAGAALMGVVDGDTVNLLSTDAAGSFADRHAGTGKSVAISGLALDNGDYQLAPVSATAAIVARALTGSITVGNKVYDGTTLASVTGSSLAGVIDGDDVTLVVGEALFESKDAGMRTAAAGVTLAGADAANYTVNSTAAGEAEISPRALTVLVNDASRTYGSPNPAFAVDYAGFAAGEDASVLSGMPEFATDAAEGSNAGMYEVTASGLSSGNYAITYVAGTLTVVRAASTISIAWSGGVYDGEARVAQPTIAGPGLVEVVPTTVRYYLGSDESGVPLGAAPVDAGTYFVAIAWEGDANHEASSATASMTIAPRQVTVRADDVVKTYGDAEPALGYRLIEGGLAGDDAFTGGLVREAGETAGTYAITQGNLALPSNYLLQFVPGTLSIQKKALAVSVDDLSIAYGETPTFTVRYEGFVIGEDAGVLSGVLAFSGAGTGAGSHVVSAGGVSAANYEIAFVDGILTVEKAVLTVKADDHVRPFGAPNPLLTYSMTGYVNGETLADIGLLGTVELSTDATEASPTGQYAIAISGDLASANYRFVYLPGTLAVGLEGSTVTIDWSDGIYDGEGQAAIARATGAGGLDIEVADLTYFAGPNAEGTPLAGAPVDAGVYTVRAVFAGDANHAGSYAVATVTIGRAAAIISVQGYEATYTGTGHAATGSALGVKGEDLSGLLDLSGTVHTNAGEYTGDAWAFGGNSNYLPAAGTVENRIERAEAAIVVSGFAGVYDGVAHGAAGITLGVMGEDLSGLLDLGETFTDAPGGVAAWTFAGNENYQSASGSVTIEIARAGVTLNGQWTGWMYDGTAHDATAGVDGPGTISGSVTIAYFHAADVGFENPLAGAPRDAGEYVARIVFEGDANHVGSTLALAATVAPRSITVAADAAGKVYGEVDPLLSFHVAEGSLAEGDAIDGAPVRAAGEDAGTYAIGQGTVSAGGNYQVVFVGADFVISAATSNVMITWADATYDGQAKPAEAVVMGAGGLNAQASRVLYYRGLSTAPEEQLPGAPVDAGVYTVLAQYDGDANHEAAFATGAITIARRGLTLEALAQTRVYGEADPELGWQVVTGSLVDGDALVGMLARDAGEDVGSYAIGLHTLSAGANYDLTYLPAGLVITARDLVVTVEDLSIVYGQTPAFTARYEGFAFGEDAGVLSGVLVFSGAEMGAGSYLVSAGGIASANYTIIYVDGTLTVEKAVLTVRANDLVRPFGAPNPPFTWSVSGFVNGETLEDIELLGTVELSTDATEASPTGQYAIAVSGDLTSANYRFVYMPGTLAVGLESSTVTIDWSDGIYNGEGHGAIARATGAGGLDVAITDLAYFAGATAEGTLLVAPPVDAGIYTVKAIFGGDDNHAASFAVATITIARAQALIEVGSYDVAYTGTGHAATGSAVGVKGEDLSGLLDLSGTVHTNAGDYTGDAWTFAGDHNYQPAAGSVNNQIVRTSASITVGGYVGTYDGLPHGASGSALGVQGEDLSSLLSLGEAFSNAPGGSAAWTFQGDQNYLPASGSVAIDIAPAAVNLKVDWAGRVYDGTAHEAGASVEAPGVVTGSIVLHYYLAADTGFENPLAGAPRDAGEYVVRAVFDGDVNHAPASSSAAVTIAARPMTPTADAGGKVYGQDDPSLTWQVTEGTLVAVDSLAGVLSRESGEDAGTYGIALGTVTAGANYVLTFISADFVIARAPSTVEITWSDTLYDGGGQPAVAAVTGAGGLSASADRIIYYRGSGTSPEDELPGIPEDAGLYTVLAQYDGDLNHEASFAIKSITIAPRSLTISAGPLEKTYGEADPVLTWQITGGSLADGDALTGSLSRLPGEDAGSYAIVLHTLSAGSNYDISFVPANFAIAPRGLVVTVDDLAVIYGTAPVFSVQYDGFANGEDAGSLGGELSFSGAGTTVGEYVITASGLASANYEISFLPGTLTIGKKSLTITAASTVKTYGQSLVFAGTEFLVNEADLIQGDSIDSVALASDGAAATAGVSGSGYAIVISGAVGAGLENYEILFVPGELVVNPAAITIAADPQAKFFGETDPALTYRLTGDLFNGDMLTGALDRQSGEDVGEYAITQGTLGAGSNYSVTFIGASLTILQSTGTVTQVSGGTFTYDGAAHAAVSQVTGAGGLSTIPNSIRYYLGTDTTGTFTLDAPTNAGVYTVVAEYAGDANHAPSSGQAVITILPRTLTLTLAAHHKTYDQLTAATIDIADDRLPGDMLSITFTSATFADARAGTGKAVTIDGLSLTGDAAANYRLVGTTAMATADILPLAINCSITVEDRIYDGSTDASIIGRSLMGVLPGDEVLLTGGVASFDDRHAGTGKAVVVSGLLLAGAQASNYMLPGSATTTASILPRLITVAPTATTRIYDGGLTSSEAPSITSGTLAPGDVAAFTQAFVNRNVGIGKLLVVSGGAVLDGNGGNNYVVTAINSATGSITPRPISVAGIAAADKTYDGDALATLNVDAAALEGVVTSDLVFLQASGAQGAFADRHAGIAKPITIAGLALSGDDAANYSLTSATAFATIHPAMLTLTAVVDTKTYDGVTTSAAVPVVDGLRPGDSISGLRQVYLDRHAGSGKTLRIAEYALLDGNGGNNYAVVTVESTDGIIEKAPLTISAAPSTKMYDGTTAASAAPLVSGLMDPDTVSGLLEAYADRHAGAGKILQVTAYAIEDGNGGNNYTVSLVKSNAGIIEQATLILTAVADEKVYDGTATSTAVPTFDGLIPGDQLTGLVQSFDNRQAGPCKTLAISGYTIDDGNGGNNYAVVKLDMPCGTILPRALTLASISVNSKPYDGTAKATLAGAIFTGAIPGDDVTIGGGDLAFDSRDIGIGRTVTATNLALIGSDALNYTLSPTTATTTADITPTSVLGRHLFYKGSAFDHASPGQGNFDSAIAPDKKALLPGQAASFAHYSSYSRGINGIAIDLAGTILSMLPGDFDFKVGNGNDLALWVDAPAPSAIFVRPGAGVDGSTRIELVWEDNVICKQWLQVTVVSGLAAADVFYFGSAIGDTGDSADARVTIVDALGARANPATIAAIDNAYDLNRDGVVNAADTAIAAGNLSNCFTELVLITPPAAITRGSESDVPPVSGTPGLVTERVELSAARPLHGPVIGTTVVPTVPPLPRMIISSATARSVEPVVTPPVVSASPAAPGLVVSSSAPAVRARALKMTQPLLSQRLTTKIADAAAPNRTKLPAGQSPQPARNSFLSVLTERLLKFCRFRA